MPGAVGEGGLVTVGGGAAGFGPEVADVVAFWAVVLGGWVSWLCFDWFGGVVYPGDYLYEIGLVCHVENVLHAGG